jgi:hypothetical protein
MGASGSGMSNLVDALVRGHVVAIPVGGVQRQLYLKDDPVRFQDKGEIPSAFVQVTESLLFSIPLVLDLWSLSSEF